MFKTLAALVPKDRDLPDRVWRLTVLQKFLDGSIYDLLPYEFFQERTRDGKYVPISERAPSARYGLLKTVVADSTAFLFGEGRFPTIDCSDEGAETSLNRIARDAKLNGTMLDASIRGSVGSAAILVRVLGSRLFLQAMDNTVFLTPTFRADAPDMLERVVERYKVQGSVLKNLGYAIAEDELAADFWFQRQWDDNAETWFTPWLVSASRENRGAPIVPQVDHDRTVMHNLGITPMIWVRNLPGGDGIDGACTFESAIANSIEIDVQLSQAGRGLKYSSSPTLVMTADKAVQKDTHIVGDALVVPLEGDAKLLEIRGDAASAVLDYVRELRKLALESVGGSRADSDKLSAGTSGRALELMNQPLIGLCDKLRSSYGEEALVDVLRIIARISREIALVDRDGVKIPAIPADARINLKWPRWFAPTADDRQADAVAIATLTGAGVLSKEAAISALAGDYGIDDVEAELAKIARDAASTPPPLQIVTPVPAE